MAWYQYRFHSRKLHCSNQTVDGVNTPALVIVPPPDTDHVPPGDPFCVKVTGPPPKQELVVVTIVVRKTMVNSEYWLPHDPVKNILNLAPLSAAVETKLYETVIVPIPWPKLRTNIIPVCAVKTLKLCINVFICICFSSQSKQFPQHIIRFGQEACLRMWHLRP